MSALPDDAAILLVEDDENDVELMRHAFAEAGIVQKLEHAADGQKAVDYLAHRAPPALILLDLKLPLKSGFEVLKWMRSEGASSPVIVLTSSAESRDVRRAYELCANAYLVKPACHAELIALLKCMKTFWLERNVFPT